MGYMEDAEVGIIMGSGSDARIMRGAGEILDGFGIKHEDQIVSAHRTPARLEEYARHAEEGGFKAIIAGAGGAAHLPGMVASHTIIPVIGVPIMAYNDGRDAGGRGVSAFGGLDSLLSISEMPTGSPVAVVGVNKSANAGIYAAKILAGTYPELGEKLREFSSRRRDAVLKESEDLRRLGLAGFAGKGEKG